MNYEYYNNNELMHYGVLGMKWGVRRANSAASKSAKAYSKSNAEFEKATKKAGSLLFGNSEQTYKRGIKAGYKADKAMNLGEKNNRIVNKQNTKYEKQMAKYDKAIASKSNGPETTAKIQAKRDKLAKEYEKTLSKVKVSDIDKLEKHSEKVDNFIDRYEKRVNRSDRVYGIH